MLAVLEGRSLDYGLTPETQSDETELLQFPVPPNAVDPVLDALEDAGVDIQPDVICSRRAGTGPASHGPNLLIWARGTERSYVRV